MAASDVTKLVREAYKTEKLYLIIVLTDGTAFCGKLPTLFREPCDVKKSIASETENNRNGYLTIENTQVYKEYLVYIPLAKIAGVSYFGFSQNYTEKKTGPPVSGQFLIGSAKEKLFEDVLNKARIQSFGIKKIHLCYRLAVHRPITWGKITFNNETPLYCDWNFLNITSGGLSSLGASFVVGFSAGWKKSLWGVFRKKVSETQVKFDKIHAKQEVTVSGFVRFLEFPNSTSSLEKTSNFLEMEGEKWCCAIISNKEIKKKKQINDTLWAMGYFRQDAFMYPKDLWDKFSQEIKIYGEVVPANLKTEFGLRSYFIKARAAAFI